MLPLQLFNYKMAKFHAFCLKLQKFPGESKKAVRDKEIVKYKGIFPIDISFKRRTTAA